MGKQPQARKKRQVNRHKPRFMKVKNYRQKNLKDLDEVHDTIKKLDDKPAKPSLEVNEDLPGLGQFHCLECSRYFIDEQTLEGHKRSKPHKRRVKEMKETPYSHSEAEAAAGLGNYTVKRKIEDDAPVDSKKRRKAQDA